jgi:hypothetical protein
VPFIFGAVHFVLGIPLFAVLIISLVGLWLTRHYWKGGSERSALYHATFNLIVLTIVGAMMVLQ